MIIINYYKGNGCFVGHFFCVDTQFSLDAARIERPQICRLLYFIILTLRSKGGVTQYFRFDIM